MKPRLPLLLSLALNAALLAGVVALASLPRADGTAPSRVRVVLKRIPRAAPPPTTPAPAAAPRAVVVTNAPPPAFHWSQLESEDYAQYLANLRGIGCPEETACDILRADVADLFRQRLKALIQPLHAQYWALLAKGHGDQNPVIEETLKQIKELQTEQSELLSDLLGSPDGKTEQTPPGRYEQLLGDVLSVEKLAQLRELGAKYVRLDAELREQLASAPKAELEKQLAALHREGRQAQDALLTPEEIAEYRLRTSPIANARETFSALLNEEEFRKLAALGVKIGDKADAASNDQVKTVIGPERFAEFQRVQDNDFLQLEKLARRTELPRETAVQVYEMKRAADAQLLRVKADKSLSDETRDELVRAIHAESERATAAALGERAMKAYRKLGGEWIGR